MSTVGFYKVKNYLILIDSVKMRNCFCSQIQIEKTSDQTTSSLNIVEFRSDVTDVLSRRDTPCTPVIILTSLCKDFTSGFLPMKRHNTDLRVPHFLLM